MADLRDLLLDTARAACDLVASPEVAARWDEPSALPHFRVRGLAGHLVAAGTSVVVRYLDRPEPGGETIDPATYYVTALTTDDPDAELHRGIRARGEAAAEGGPEALVAEGRRVLDGLAARLAAEPADRKVQVLDGMVLTLDDYLVTRLLELVVHADDLAVSVGVPTPAFDAPVLDPVLDCLVQMGRRRHGDLAVLRALTRRERDDVQALRVL